MVSLQENEIDIHEHAIDRYIERIKELPVDIASMSMRDTAEMRLIEAAKSPEIEYTGDRRKPPIHIKGDVAIPVDKSGLPDEKAVVPTTYRAEVFRKRANEQRNN